MSVNLYNAETNELELLAGASEIPRWSGTQAEFNALDKNSLADGTIIEITDDLSNIFSTWTGTSAEFEALDKTTLADGCYINITDDESVYNNNYSTSEIDTGRKWTNGKNIYRKVFNLKLGFKSAENWYEIASMSEVKQVVFTAVEGNGTYYPSVVGQITGGILRIYPVGIGVNLDNLIVEYTKNTD